LKAIMNNPVGLTAVLKRNDGISIITLCLDCDSIKVRPVVLQLLAAVCFVPRAFKSVLEGLDNYTRVKKDKCRFYSIINDMYREDVEYNISAMVFLNAIVSGSEEIQVRFNIREEVLAVGLKDLMPVRNYFMASVFLTPQSLLY
jgi:dishevelled associated activator of morphogenesis